jgi:hypothetical protein
MEFTVNKTRFEILDYFRSGKENSKWTDFLIPRTIDFDEVVLKENQIEIYRKPKFTSAFRPSGKIIISINEISDDKSCLIGKIFPYNGKGYISIIFLITFLIIFTIGALFLSQNTNTISMIFIAWIMVAIGIVFEYYNSKSGLIKYLKEIINILDKEKKASR